MNNSLRDQFAIAAMQGFCSLPDSVDWSHEHTATAAYQQADAMLVEREKSCAESKDKIKQLLVDAVNKNHPGLCPSLNDSAEKLIFQLSTGLPF